jgi:hypothetical protein
MLDHSSKRSYSFSTNRLNYFDSLGALDFWKKRSCVDRSIAERAVWADEAVQEALLSATSWVNGLPFVLSLSGYWKFHLSRCPEDVPADFHSIVFDDSLWNHLPGKVNISISCVHK